MKEEMLVKALQKKLNSGSSSLNVLLHNFRRQHPLMLGLVSKLSKVSSQIGTKDEPSQEEILELINEIKNA